MTTNAKKGNSFLLQQATTFDGATFATIAAAKTTSMVINNTTVDITNKDSNAWQELCSGGGVKSISVTMDGIYSDGTSQSLMIEASMAATSWNFQIIDALGDTFTGSFHVESLTFAGDANDAETFSLSLSSQDEIVYTAA